MRVIITMEIGKGMEYTLFLTEENTKGSGKMTKGMGLVSTTTKMVG